MCVHPKHARVISLQSFLGQQGKSFGLNAKQAGPTGRTIIILTVAITGTVTARLALVSVPLKKWQNELPAVLLVSLNVT